MNYEQILSDMGDLLVNSKEKLIAILPNLIFAIIIVLVGMLIARLLQGLVNRLINNLDRYISHKKPESGITRFRLDGSVRLVGKIVYWIIIVFFLTIATEVMGLPLITTWLSGLVQYLPNLLIAAIMIFLGIIGGKLLRDIIITASGTAGLLYGNVLGKIVQYAVLLITILIALDQVGINIAILTELIDIVLAAVLFGAALAFGLGARTSISNILACYYLQNRYKVGETVRIDNIEGQIIEFTSTSIIVRSDTGQITIPAKKFSEETSILVEKEG